MSSFRCLFGSLLILLLPCHITAFLAPFSTATSPEFFAEHNGLNQMSVYKLPQHETITMSTSPEAHLLDVKKLRPKNPIYVYMYDTDTLEPGNTMRQYLERVRRNEQKYKARSHSWVYDPMTLVRSRGFELPWTSVEGWYTVQGSQVKYTPQVKPAPTVMEKNVHHTPHEDHGPTRKFQLKLGLGGKQVQDSLASPAESFGRIGSIRYRVNAG